MAQETGKARHCRLKLAIEIMDKSSQSVLDVGCDDPPYLKNYLGEGIRYQGLDAKGGKGIIACDLEKGIPSADNSYDAVVAIEVLEHIENAGVLFLEMLRVAKKEVIFSAPNHRHWMIILTSFLGKGGEDIFTYRDSRHLWQPCYKSVKKFVENSKITGKITFHGTIYPYKRFKFLRITDRILSRFFPNLFYYTVICKIKL